MSASVQMTGTEQTQPGTDLQAVIDAAQRVLADRNDPQWLQQLRERGNADVASMRLPTRRDEAWRYTPLSFLDKEQYAPVDGPVDALELSDIEDLLLANTGGTRLVFVNGYFVRGLSPLTEDANGALLTVISEADAGTDLPTRRAVGEHLNFFAAMNSAICTDGAVIRVPAGMNAEQPIEVLHISLGLDQPGISHLRHRIDIEAGARAHLIERYCALGDSVYFNNATIEVNVAADAGLVHERLQEESANAQHLSTLDVHLSERSQYSLVHGGLGGAWSRTDIQVVFGGEQAEAVLDGLLLAGDRQFNDVHLAVRHNEPQCNSQESFRSILDGSGRVVFDGLVVVALDAQKTDAVLSNHNLMLSRSAEVDTKPQLEIYADDVKCSHGTTVGELDADMLFYLRSRGLSETRAKQMLCHGFAQAVLDKYQNEPLRQRAATILANRLAETV